MAPEFLKPSSLSLPLTRGQATTGGLTVDTVVVKRLYVLFFLGLASRRVVFTACGEHPGGDRLAAPEAEESAARRSRVTGASAPGGSHS